jgi:hypothetical protein
VNVTTPETLGLTKPVAVIDGLDRAEVKRAEFELALHKASATA